MARRWMTVLLVLALIVGGCQSAETGEDSDKTPEEGADQPAVGTATEVGAGNETEESIEVTDDFISSKSDEVSIEEEAVEEVQSDSAEDAVVGDDAPDDNEEDDFQEAEPVNKMEVPPLGSGAQVQEMKAVWLSYLDLQPIFALGTEEAYRRTMEEVITNSKTIGMNTLMYQVRPFGDALYPSAIFPTSYIITGIEGAPLSYDPFKIAVDLAHAQGMRIEAWINPYRIRTATSTVPISENNQAGIWLEDGSRRVLQSSEGTIVYNPSLEEVRNKIVDGVGEIINLYAVDGIHFDDYFYPTTDSSFDEIEYLGFFHDSDGLTQDEWRRVNVNKLISEVYETIGQANRHIVFGISPQGDIDTNYNQLFADVKLWLSEPGFLDYVIPQIYFGFEHERSPYSETLEAWHNLNTQGVKIIPGLAVYKIGKEDQWAGEGKLEWVASEGMLSRMIVEAKSYETYSGYALFRYDYLFKPEEALVDRMHIEIEAMKALAQ